MYDVFIYDQNSNNTTTNIDFIFLFYFFLDNFSFKYITRNII